MLPSPQRLRELAAEVPGARLHGDADPLIHSIVYDSRQAAPGCLFVALRGLQADGLDYVSAAVARGAVAIAAERKPNTTGAVPVLETPDTRKALAELAWAFYGHPERKLTMAAVTGTNGKTTVASLLHHVLEASNRPAGLIGTLGIRYGESAIDTARTTPEAADLAGYFAAMWAAGCSHAVMEATSIGIDRERTWRLPFRVTIFTNLSRDHLDYHGSLEAYRDAKLRLFREQQPDGIAVINRDDPAAAMFIAAARARVLTYSIETDADYQATNVQLGRGLTTFELHTPQERMPVTVPLIGQFNLSNVLAVIAAAGALDVPLASCVAALRGAPVVRGRMEAVPSPAPFTVIVDYAHTPDALEKVLTALAGTDHRRLITVVGAGGDRDRGKRPLMAAAACRLSDLVILTSDNPRSEAPEAILDDLAAGVVPDCEWRRIADRRTAIGRALAAAQAGDIVLIAGKGHETYQEICGVRHPFDDCSVAREGLEQLGYRHA